MVILNKIYTRTGDDGTTALGSGERRPKYDLRVASYGTVDEANACIGLARLHTREAHPELDAMLGRIQNDLFDAGADLSTPIEENPKYPPLRITPEYVEQLEKWCDSFNEDLPNLKSFILPGGTKAGALLHSARVVARRAERHAWVAVREFPETTSVWPAKYLNRLSDLLFILSRVANAGDDVLWVPGGERGPDTIGGSSPDANDDAAAGDAAADASGK